MVLSLSQTKAIKCVFIGQRPSLDRRVLKLSFDDASENRSCCWLSVRVDVAPPLCVLRCLLGEWWHSAHA